MQENQKQPLKNISPLARLMAERIRAEGPMSVAEYMELALAHPEHGYYVTRNPIGVVGDFTTAPEVSQMFGEMIGAWIVDTWMQMGRPDDVKLVELGPGRGTLSADIMRTVSAWPDFKAAATLHLVEVSPKLREAQAITLKGQRAAWYDSFAEVPEGACFVIANEFFDALPIHQFEKVSGAWCERKINHDAGQNKFFFTTAPLDIDIGGVMPASFMDAPDGSIFEISPASLSVAEEISRRIAEHGGAALVIDYGHAEPWLGDTLQAVSRHKFADPLEDPGERDITAHVDFGTLATVAKERVAVTPVVAQGRFLITLGIEARAEKLGEKADNDQRRKIMTDLCRLVAPQEMGRLFKVLAFTSKSDNIVPAGFDITGNDHETPDD